MGVPYSIVVFYDFVLRTNIYYTMNIYIDRFIYLVCECVCVDIVFRGWETDFWLFPSGILLQNQDWGPLI